MNVCAFHQKNSLFVNNIIAEMTEKSPCEDCCMNHLCRTDEIRLKKSLKQIQKIEVDWNLDFLSIFKQILEYYEQSLIIKITAFKSFISNTIQTIQYKTNTTIQFDQIYLNQKQFIVYLNEKLLLHIKDLKSSSNLEKLESLVNKAVQQKQNNLNTIKYRVILDQPRSEENQQHNNFKLTLFASINYPIQCKVIALSYDSNLIIVGDKNVIKIFQNKEQSFKESQTLFGHKKEISCLQFLEDNLNFVSGGFDGLIIIWGLNLEKKWEIQQKISGHQYKITCLKFHLFQKIFVSSGVDCSVKFWKFQPLYYCWTALQQLNFTSYVVSVNFSYTCSRLYLSEVNNNIWVIEDINGQWRAIKIMQVNYNVMNLISIGSNCIIQLSNIFDLFIYKRKDVKFEKNQKIILNQDEQQNNGFFLTYLNQNNKYFCLLVSNGNSIFITQCI